MHHEMGDVIVRTRCVCARASLQRGLVSEHDVAEKAPAPLDLLVGGEGQYVGRRILAAPGAVQRAHLGIVGEDAG